jgi:ABC-type uncharacterized transport system ATPase subunit
MNYAIETNGLSKFYGDVCAVDSVDLRVGVGEIYGFLGLNGAGKTDWVFVGVQSRRPLAIPQEVADVFKQQD